MKKLRTILLLALISTNHLTVNAGTTCFYHSEYYKNYDFWIGNESTTGVLEDAYEKNEESDTLLYYYRTLVNSSLNIAEALFYDGKIRKALELIDLNLDIVPSKKAALKTSIAKLHIKRGKLIAFQSFTTNSGFKEGLSSLKTAKTMLDTLKDSKDLSEMYLYKGFLNYSHKYLVDKGSYDTALYYFTKSLKLREKIKDHHGIAEAYIYIGVINERKGFEKEAEKYYRKSLEISEKYGHKLLKSYATRHIGFIRENEAKLDMALELLNESLLLREEVGFKLYLPFSHLSVGEIYFKKEVFDKALDHFRKAYAIAEEMDAKRVKVICLISIGLSQKQNRDYNGAKESLEKAKLLAQEIGYKNGIKKATEELNKLIQKKK